MIKEVPKEVLEKNDKHRSEILYEFLAIHPSRGTSILELEMHYRRLIKEDEKK